MNQKISLDDALIIAGVMILGTSIWWWAGGPGLLGFVGALLLALGCLLAWQR